jgi:hypothetical protein
VTLLSIDDPDDAAGWLRQPDPDVLTTNVEQVRPHCSLDDLPHRLDNALQTFGDST